MNKRTCKPESGNKFYITTSKGGYNTCIEGKPTDKYCNVLANCVGYASGRFNEIIGEYKYKTLNCNAENFIERAEKAGLKISKVPVLGGIMVWQKGNTLSGNDGAGHVAIVEEIKDANTIYTSESAYSGTAFFNATRSNSNGRWGMANGYTFRGCIINPAIGDIHYTENIPEEPKKEDDTPVNESLLLLVRRTIRGDFGNGKNRKTILVTRYGEETAKEVQRQVNLNVKDNNWNWDKIHLYK